MAVCSNREISLNLRQFFEMLDYSGWGQRSGLHHAAYSFGRMEAIVLKPDALIQLLKEISNIKTFSEACPFLHGGRENKKHLNSPTAMLSGFASHDSAEPVPEKGASPALDQQNRVILGKMLNEYRRRGLPRHQNVTKA